MKATIDVVSLFLVTLVFSAGCGSKGGNDGPSDQGHAGGQQSNVIGAAGGTVTSADQRVSVEIPPGALSVDTDITITETVGPSNGLVGPAYAFGPSGLAFALPVTLTVSYVSDQVPASLGEANLGLGVLTNGEWHPIDESTTDPSQNQVRAATLHFSVFGVIGRAMYISDTGANHRIVRVKDLTGDGWTTYDGTSESADLVHPLGMVATDGEKRLLITDWGSSQIIRITDMEGKDRMAFGRLGSGRNQFDHPAGIAVDSKGRIYIADRGNHRIVRIDDLKEEDNGWTTYGARGIGEAEFDLPSGIVVDRLDRIYITDWGNHRIVRISDMTGAEWVAIGSEGSDVGHFQNPAGITVDSRGRIYASDWGNHRVVRMDDLSGGNWNSVGSLGTGDGYFNHPAGIAVDPRGRIHVVDRENNRVVRMNSMAGDGWISFGSVGSEVGRFKRPVGIALAVEANR